MTERKPRLVYFCPVCHRIFINKTTVCPNCHGATITHDADMCPHCRQTLPDGASTCPHCKRAVVDSLATADETLCLTSSNPTILWYLVAFLLGLIGAFIGYIEVKDRSETMADRLLLIGVIMTLVDIAIYLFYLPLLFQ